MEQGRSPADLAVSWLIMVKSPIVPIITWVRRAATLFQTVTTLYKLTENHTLTTTKNTKHPVSRVFFFRVGSRNGLLAFGELESAACAFAAVFFAFFHA